MDRETFYQQGMTRHLALYFGTSPDSVPLILSAADVLYLEEYEEEMKMGSST